MSLGPFLFHLSDLVHVAAAMCVVGAVIVDFDDKIRSKGYFDEIDEASWRASQATFPGLPTKRLFDGYNILEQGRCYWRLDARNGLDMLLNGLSSALGFWDSEEDHALP